MIHTVAVRWALSRILKFVLLNPAGRIMTVETATQMALRSFRKPIHVNHAGPSKLMQERALRSKIRSRIWLAATIAQAAIASQVVLRQAKGQTGKQDIDDKDSESPIEAGLTVLHPSKIHEATPTESITESVMVRRHFNTPMLESLHQMLAWCTDWSLSISFLKEAQLWLKDYLRRLRLRMCTSATFPRNKIRYIRSS